MVLSSNLSGKFRKRRDGTTKCRPSSSFILTCRASCQKDRTGRLNVVRPRPGPGRTDCPVENTAGRPYIKDEIVGYFDGALQIPLSPTRSDVNSYLDMRLDSDPIPNAMDDELREDITRVVLEMVSEM